MPPLIYTTINSGQKVSGNVDLGKYPKLLNIALPGMTSGDCYLHGSPIDTTSADFRRLSTNAGEYTQATGVGSMILMWSDQYHTPPYLRYESLVAQTDVRTLVFHVR